MGWGPFFEAGRLLTFFAFRIGAYSRWALIRGWALIRINIVLHCNFSSALIKKYGTHRDMLQIRKPFFLLF